MLMSTVNYLRVIDCEQDAANRNLSYKKDHRDGKMKLVNAYLYNNRLIDNYSNN